MKQYDCDCDNGYNIHFSDIENINNGAKTEKIELTVKKNGITHRYPMKQVRAASGVKYKSMKDKYIYWEHQGEAIFGTEDSTYCNCKL